MKKTYIIPEEKVVDLGLDGQLLSDSNTGAGGYDGDGKPTEPGVDMDEDGSNVKAQGLWNQTW